MLNLEDLMNEAIKDLELVTSAIRDGGITIAEGRVLMKKVGEMEGWLTSIRKYLNPYSDLSQKEVEKEGNNA